MNHTKKALTLSIVIPCYNEEKYIGSCLDSIANQNTPPDEVIVVDNNCIDKTIEIARKYGFVKVIAESKQGPLHARNAGFKAVTSDLIGRIDADTTISSNWVEYAKERFSEDPELAGLTGTALAQTNSLFKKSPYSTFFPSNFLRYNRCLYRANTFWGANQVCRKTDFFRVIDILAKDDLNYHEDIDLSLALIARGGKIKYDPKLLVTVDGMRMMSFKKNWEYFLKALRTRKRHKALYRSGSKLLFPVFTPLLSVALFIFPGSLYFLNVLISPSSPKVDKNTKST